MADANPASACPFCAVIERQARGSFIFEDETVAAFLDLYPVNRGHALVVPKAHVHDLTACDAALAAHLFAVCSRLAPAIVGAAGADGFNIWTANGRAAGQTVFHLHLHILPRFADDAFGLRFPTHYPREADRADLDALADAISALAGAAARGSSSRG